MSLSKNSLVNMILLVCFYFLFPMRIQLGLGIRLVGLYLVGRFVENLTLKRGPASMLVLDHSMY